MGHLRFFLEGVAESAHTSIARAEALLALRRDYHARLASARSSALLLKLVDARILVEVTGRRRDRRYVAREILVVAHGEPS